MNMKLRVHSWEGYILPTKGIFLKPEKTTPNFLSPHVVLEIGILRTDALIFKKSTYTFNYLYYFKPISLIPQNQWGI